MENLPQKTAFIAIIGSPNAGKSTLLNYLVGAKVSITSAKRQTTRNMISGIAIEKNAQLIFLDTPGIFTARQKMEKTMVQTAWNEVTQADYTLLVIDSKKGLTEEVRNIIERLGQLNTKLLVALNKVDLINKNKLLGLASELAGYHLFQEIFMLSSISGEGVEHLRSFFAENAKLEPWPYPEDEITTLPRRFMAAEITREQLFLKLSEELPYSVAVETEKWEETATSITIHQLVYVNKLSQKKIVIGQAGSMIKAVGQAARHAIAELLDKRVHLFLFVKVKDDWQDDPNVGGGMK